MMSQSMQSLVAAPRRQMRVTRQPMKVEQLLMGPCEPTQLIFGMIVMQFAARHR